MAIVVTLLIVGFLLLLAETILPGLVAGSLGMVSLFAAVVTAYSELGVDAGHLTLAGVLGGLGVGTFLWFRYLPGSSLARPYISNSTIGGIDNTRTDLLGKSGAAKTALRPSGIALIEGERVDVVTEGNLIEAGTPVRVVAVEGLRVVVRSS
ncbi:MAG: NfeD family protein [Verrucomicrobiae bacterium]|jgi:membrane-bound serine protease (ClpP class)|nr:NfeD family protein [Verrucomicrobiae bacterium]